MLCKCLQSLATACLEWTRIGVCIYMSVSPLLYIDWSWFLPGSWNADTQWEKTCHSRALSSQAEVGIGKGRVVVRSSRLHFLLGDARTTESVMHVHSMLYAPNDKCSQCSAFVTLLSSFEHVRSDRKQR